MIAISHGYKIDKEAKIDPYVELVERVGEEFTMDSRPGAWLVDTLPIRKAPSHIKHLTHPFSVRYLPEWLPFTTFKKVAAEHRKTLIDMVNYPYDFVKEQLKVHLPSHRLCEYPDCSES